MQRQTLPRGPSNSVLPLIKYFANPYTAAIDAVEKYGDPLTVRSPAGDMVMTGNPVGAKQILAAPPETFDAYSLDLLGEIIGRHSLMVLSGERHRAARKLLLPPFHGERMLAYGRLMRETALRWAARWPPDAPFSMFETTHAISLEVIIRAVFGVTDSVDVERLRTEIIDLIDGIKPSFLFVKALRREFGGVGPWANFRRAFRRVEERMQVEIAARRREGRYGEDILSLLLQARYDDGSPMGDGEVLEQLLTLLLAGKEPTAVALAWALHNVHRHPLVLERLLAAVDALGPDCPPDKLAAEPYLEAVCLETLRQNPISPVVARKLTRPLSVMGYELAPGMGVGISVVCVHHRADLYPEPDTFRPERFLERSFSPFEFLPFGGGGRRCPAAAFALYQMKIVLGTLLLHYRLHNVRNQRMRPVPRVTFVSPAGGVQMVATRRRPS